MNHWQAGARSDEAWRYLLDKLDPAIALLTEARPPARLIEDGRVVFEEVERRGKLGISGLRPPTSSSGTYRVDATHPGAFVAAELDMPNLDAPITAISLYGLLERLLGTEYSIPSLHRSISDLTVLLDDRSRRGRVILGGDLNASPVRWGNAHRILFDRIEDFGLVCCRDFKSGRRRRTEPWRSTMCS